MTRENKILSGGIVATLLICVVAIFLATSIQSLRKKIEQVQTRMDRAEANLSDQQAELISLKQAAMVPAITQQPDADKTQGIAQIAKSELSSYIPDSCPPGGTYPTTKVKGIYTLVEMGCADSNWSYGATLVRHAASNKDLVAFVMSSSDLRWKVAGGEEHVLTAVGDKSWDSFTDFGGDQPVTIFDLTLDGKRLNLLKPYVVGDGGLGAFQGVKFFPNQNYTGGKLTVNGLNFVVDFNTVTVATSK